MLRTTMIGVLWLASAAAPVPVVPKPHVASPFASETTRSNPAEQTAPQADLLPFAIDRTERMTVHVRIGDNGPFAFLVDTGSERTSISRQLATRLGLAGGSTARVHSVLGSKMVATVQIPRLAVGKQALSVVNAPIFEAVHIGADGMLGLDALRSQRVMFDFKSREMHIVPSRYERVGVEDDHTIVVRARSRGGRLILTKASIDGIPIAVIIDTGSQLSIGNRALRSRLERARRIAIRPDPANPSKDRAIIESVTGEVELVDYAQIKRLDLGGVELHRVGIAFSDARIFKQLGYDDKPALLLGIDAMRSFDRVAIDFAQKKVRFVLPSVGMLERYQSAQVSPIASTTDLRRGR